MSRKCRINEYKTYNDIPKDNAMPEVITDYERRVRDLESEGMTTSDAQAVADAELS